MTLALRNCRYWGAFLFRAAVSLSFYFAAGDCAWAQRLGQGSDDGISAWRVVATLLLCAGVAVIAALFLKYRTQSGAVLFRPNRVGPRLAMVENLRLRPQIDLCIVSCDKEELLIVISPQGTQLLRHLSGGSPLTGPGGGS